MYRYEVTSTVKSDIEGVTGKYHFYDESGKYYINEDTRHLSINYYDSATDSFPVKTLDEICQDLYGTDFDAQSTQTSYTQIQQVEVPTDKPVHLHAVAEATTLRARMIGIFNQTLTRDTTTDLDWAIPQLSYLGVNKPCIMDGIEYFASGSVAGDKITFQIVDKDNILGYGAGAVLDEFGTDWAVMPNKAVMLRLYKANLIVGLYIRVKYTSTGTTDDVKFVCNLFRHMDVS